MQCVAEAEHGTTGGSYSICIAVFLFLPSPRCHDLISNPEVSLE